MDGWESSDETLDLSGGNGRATAPTTTGRGEAEPPSPLDEALKDLDTLGMDGQNDIARSSFGRDDRRNNADVSQKDLGTFGRASFKEEWNGRREELTPSFGARGL